MYNLMPFFKVQPNITEYIYILICSSLEDSERRFRIAEYHIAMKRKHTDFSFIFVYSSFPMIKFIYWDIADV